MDFQVVVLAGGTAKNLDPLVSKEVPKALLPVANRPVISYVLEQLEQSNLKDLIVVVEGKDAALLVSSWISGAYVDRLHVEVAAVPEDVGTAGAIRAIAHHLTAKDILVVSGDLVSDVPPGAVAATHRRHDAVVTAMLCSVPVSGPSDSGPSSGKDKTKKPRYNIIGLDSSKQFLLHLATGTEIEKDIRIQKSILRAAGQMEVRSDLMDAHMYAFKRYILLEVLDQKATFQSLKQDILPFLVRNQLKSEILKSAQQKEENGNGNGNLTAQSNQTILSRILANASRPSLHELYALNSMVSAPAWRTHKCCVYIASNSKYCVRLNSIQAFMDINRDVIGEANHLSGYSFSSHNNIIDPSAVLGSKTTVGPHCMLGEGSQMGDKCSVKRSVIGRHCRIGSNVKVCDFVILKGSMHEESGYYVRPILHILVEGSSLEDCHLSNCIFFPPMHVQIVNSVIMNHVAIADGCSINGSVICSNAQLQERVVLRDCQVGTGFVVTSGSEYKGETLAKKEK